VIFVSVAVLLGTVFIVVWMSVRHYVRDSVTANLAAGQRMFAALEARRQRELRSQAATLAENPTLKAALDTYQTYERTSSGTEREQLLETIDRELDRLASRIEADAIILVDGRQN